jgi:hypothetical protein
MSKLLPIRPNLEHLKHEAKSLLKAHAAGDVSACAVLRHLRRFSGVADVAILAEKLTLTEVYFALAREYGFKSWDELRKLILQSEGVAGADAPPYADALRLPDPPAGGGGNRLTRAIYMALSYCGAVCDYDTIAGDSGLAFILQADSKHTPYGANTPELDLGWWPLDEWGAMLRLEFLGRAHGIPLHLLPKVSDEWRADSAAHFAKYHRAAIQQCLEAGRPVVACAREYYLITGMDEGTPPLLGQMSCSSEAKIQRPDQYSWVVIAPGDMIEPMDRLAADAEALAFACALHHERFSRDIPGTAPEWAAVKSSGKASFALWAQVLRDGRCGPHFYSGNVIGFLKSNRRSVPPYLRAMTARHGAAAAARLHNAAGIYEQVLEVLNTANASKTAFESDAGRTELAQVVDKLAALEAQAIGELELAVKAMAR